MLHVGQASKRDKRDLSPDLLERYQPLSKTQKILDQPCQPTFPQQKQQQQQEELRHRLLRCLSWQRQQQLQRQQELQQQQLQQQQRLQQHRQQQQKQYQQHLQQGQELPTVDPMLLQPHSRPIVNISRQAPRPGPGSGPGPRPGPWLGAESGSGSGPKPFPTDLASLSLRLNQLQPVESWQMTPWFFVQTYRHFRERREKHLFELIQQLQHKREQVRDRVQSQDPWAYRDWTTEEDQEIRQFFHLYVDLPDE
ncbi:hypothetical protein B0O80DRAFT_492346 [Mortierella sp. GBAus27b]|nr:hypothetical protein B0O80DRAFT_492346 [Mortierella sp. GBAus27b]